VGVAVALFKFGWPSAGLWCSNPTIFTGDERAGSSVPWLAGFPQAFNGHCFISPAGADSRNLLAAWLRAIIPATVGFMDSSPSFPFDELAALGAPDLDMRRAVFELPWLPLVLDRSAKSADMQLWQRIPRRRLFVPFSLSLFLWLLLNPIELAGPDGPTAYVASF
jgi:hypothetical protein